MEYVKQLEAERDALRARIEDVEGMADTISAEMAVSFERIHLLKLARAVSAWLKEGK
jgi:hypothetical protein